MFTQQKEEKRQELQIKELNKTESGKTIQIAESYYSLFLSFALNLSKIVKSLENSAIMTKNFAK
jgi:hypothetical protein